MTTSKPEAIEQRLAERRIAVYNDSRDPWDEASYIGENTWPVEQKEVKVEVVGNSVVGALLAKAAAVAGLGDMASVLKA